MTAFTPLLHRAGAAAIMGAAVLAGALAAQEPQPDPVPVVRPVAPMTRLAPLAPADTALAPLPCPASGPMARGVADEGTDFARVLELSGSVPMVRSWTIVRPSDVRFPRHCAGAGVWQARLAAARPSRGGPTVELLPTTIVAHWNSAYPRLQHDAALWTGRGLSSSISAGAHGEWGLLSVTVAPIVAHHQNTAFRTRPMLRNDLSEWAYTGHPGMIDWPQRFGDEPFTTVHPGQSQVSLRARGFAIGYGTENVWWGPAQRYPLMMGAGAPGVPGLFLGTYRPVDLGIASLEMELTWGVPRESEYFDFNPDNDRRLLSGMVFVIQPHAAPGLSLGATRTYAITLPPEGLAWEDFLFQPYRDIRDNPGRHADFQDDQMLSVFARWAFPEAGFEAYIEWGREDHWADFGDFIRQPDHSRAMMAGFQKVFAGERRWVRIRGEGVVLGGANTFRAARGAQRWYTHSQVRQGHTNEGQLMGSVIGPGSDGQFLGADVFHRNGRIGAFIERVRYDDDAYYNQWARFYGHHGHDVELTGGLSQLYFLGPLDLGLDVTVSERFRRHFVGMDGAERNFLREVNTALRATVTWRPEARLGRRGR
jgi:hypothetical protein